MNKKQFADYQEHLLIKLRNEEFASAYLSEALADEDPRMFLLALKNVVDAQRNITTDDLAKQTKLTRMSLHRIMSNKGNPKLSSLISLLNAVGLQLSIQPSTRKS